MKQFQKKIEPKGADEVLSSCGSLERRHKKLIPNVSLEWINKLKDMLSKTRYSRGSSKASHVLASENQGPIYLADGEKASLPNQRGKKSKNAKGVPNLPCMTNSTAGMTFISPPMTERAHGYDTLEAEECINYGSVVSDHPSHFDSKMMASHRSGTL